MKVHMYIDFLFIKTVLLSITLEGEIILFNKSGNVALNVFKYGTREKYTSFYCYEYGSNKVLDVLHKNIQKEFYKLGIIQKEDKEINGNKN